MNDRVLLVFEWLLGHCKVVAKMFWVFARALLACLSDC